MERISYKEDKVSIGIDVHKKHYTISCLVKGRVVNKATLPPSPKKLVDYINSRFEGAEIKTVYEAGFSGFNLHRVLESAGINNIVVNASSIEVASRDRVKTDRRDSLKMAGLLECGRLRGIRVPAKEEEVGRLLHRTRGQLIQDRVRTVNRIKMRLYQFGIELPKTINETSLNNLLKLPDLEAEIKFSLKKYILFWELLDKEIREIDKAQKKLAESDKLFATYSSIPGYGLQTARMISTELGNMSQFTSERSLFSFIGLTPTERSSGEAVHKGHISRQGSSRLRCVLIEAAWTAVRTDVYWKYQYHKRVLKIGGKRAIVAIARRLLGVARALVRKGELYQVLSILEEKKEAA